MKYECSGCAHGPHTGPCSSKVFFSVSADAP